MHRQSDKLCSCCLLRLCPAAVLLCSVQSQTGKDTCTDRQTLFLLPLACPVSLHEDGIHSYRLTHTWTLLILCPDCPMPLSSQLVLTRYKVGRAKQPPATMTPPATSVMLGHERSVWQTGNHTVAPQIWQASEAAASRWTDHVLRCTSPCCCHRHCHILYYTESSQHYY